MENCLACEICVIVCWPHKFLFPKQKGREKEGCHTLFRDLKKHFPNARRQTFEYYYVFSLLMTTHSAIEFRGNEAFGDKQP